MMFLNSAAAWIEVHLRLLAGIAFGYFILTSCVSIVATFMRRWRLRICNTSEVVIDISPIWRLVAGMIGGFMVMNAGVFCILTTSELPQQIMTDPRFSSPVIQDALFGLGILEGCAVLAAGIFLIRGIVQTQVRFDLERHVCSFRRGWLRLKVTQRSMDTLVSVRVYARPWFSSSQEYNSILSGQSNGAGVNVFLEWEESQTKYPYFSFWFRSIRPARALAERLADGLHLPVNENQYPIPQRGFTR